MATIAPPVAVRAIMAATTYLNNGEKCSLFNDGLLFWLKATYWLRAALWAHGYLLAQGCSWRWAFALALATDSTWVGYNLIQ
ncbi:hypothetical protein ambt_17315 [Alteromonas naphthalenivorans]|uniref:Uncharacterized protein n=1 Tax=Alteromonas naphthalenivorans TaxID=715451 RepID=F5ZFA9_ALTNA|nr:hypothetical protein ambt_17315 [Alteromonas naphthalenivorans]